MLDQALHIHSYSTKTKMFNGMVCFSKISSVEIKTEMFLKYTDIYNCSFTLDPSWQGFSFLFCFLSSISILNYWCLCLILPFSFFAERRFVLSPSVYLACCVRCCSGPSMDHKCNVSILLVLYFVVGCVQRMKSHPKVILLLFYIPFTSPRNFWFFTFSFFSQVPEVSW